ncbi:hypothetical protein M9H77_04842 [Catharanthus roseus]|uniref:Uncharacterized protein n=2 Tax=Catharanthus roseus TaxID=4058 RepID=A0ACC0CF82_CATRO|nr:hypothetical protein M9H77_04839 [Catharanthus roseus]KAI5683614.1 hypothetical protein M9H77_04842 [Catharanthus roseus]
MHKKSLDDDLQRSKRSLKITRLYEDEMTNLKTLKTKRMVRDSFMRFVASGICEMLESSLKASLSCTRNSLLIILLVTTVLASYEETKPKGPIKVNVVITSGLPAGSKTMFVHCTMDSQDLGNRPLAPGAVYQWSYVPLPRPKEQQCSCDFNWDWKSALIEVAGDLSTCHGGMSPCSWIYTRLAFLAGRDVWALLLFSAIGKFSHGFPVLDTETLKTVDPFVAGWFLSAYFLADYSEDDRGMNGQSEAIAAILTSWAFGIPELFYEFFNDAWNFAPNDIIYSGEHSGGKSVWSTGSVCCCCCSGPSSSVHIAAIGTAIPTVAAMSSSSYHEIGVLAPPIWVSNHLIAALCEVPDFLANGTDRDLLLMGSSHKGYFDFFVSSK